MTHAPHLSTAGSADRTVRLWTRSGDKYNKDAAVISAVHGDEVTGLAMHATNAYFASSSKYVPQAFDESPFVSLNSCCWRSLSVAVSKIS